MGIDMCRITVVWCQNCGKLKVNYFSYPQCPICGASVEIEKTTNRFKKGGKNEEENP